MSTSSVVCTCVCVARVHLCCARCVVARVRFYKRKQEREAPTYISRQTFRHVWQTFGTVSTKHFDSTWANTNASSSRGIRDTGGVQSFPCWRRTTAITLAPAACHRAVALLRGVEPAAAASVPPPDSAPPLLSPPPPAALPPTMLSAAIVLAEVVRLRGEPPVAPDALALSFPADAAALAGASKELKEEDRRRSDASSNAPDAAITSAFFDLKRERGGGGREMAEVGKEEGGSVERKSTAAQRE